MLELKLTFATADDLYAAVAKLAGEAAPAAPLTPAQDANPPLVAAGETEAPTTEKKKPGRPRKEAPSAELPPVGSAATGAAEQDPAPIVPQPEPEPAPAAGGVPSTDDVKAAAEKVNAKHGIVELRKLLATFSAARISEVAEEDRAGFIAKAAEICA